MENKITAFRHAICKNQVGSRYRLCTNVCMHDDGGKTKKYIKNYILNMYIIRTYIYGVWGMLWDISVYMIYPMFIFSNQIKKFFRYIFQTFI